MAITETSPIGPAPPAIGTDRQAPSSATLPTQKTPGEGASPVAAPDTVRTPPAAASSPYNFVLRFDPDTQRMILEARDSVTGFVIFQMPPKYVIKQFSAGAADKAAPPRGGQVDGTL